MLKFLQKWLSASWARQGASTKQIVQRTSTTDSGGLPNPAVNTLQRAYDRAVVEARIQRKGLQRPQDTIFFESIERQRATDPLIGPKLGQKEVVQTLMEALSQSDSKGVHIESLFCILGSLAGYACQAAIFGKVVLNGPTELYGLNVMGTQSGDFFFGDPLNKPLAESQYSIWGLAAGYATHLGCQELIDIRELFDHVSKTVGTEDFGKPRFPGGNAGELPINHVKNLWPVLLPTVKFFCKTPDEWPILFGLAIQEAMRLTEGQIAPGDALTIVMESAVPMSKVTF